MAIGPPLQVTGDTVSSADAWVALGDINEGTDKMATNELLPLDLVEKLCKQANKLLAGCAGDESALFKAVKREISYADLAIGVWNDPAERFGVGLHVIKGRIWLDEIAEKGGPRRLRIVGIPCISIEQAVAAEQTIGDLHNETPN